MKVAAAQFRMNVKDPQANFQRMKELATTAAQQDAKLIVFPEVSNTGYDLSLLDPSLFPTEQDALQSAQAIAKSAGITLQIGLAVNSGNSRENLAALVDRTGCLLRYSKTHLFDMKDSRESDLFERGARLVMAEWSGWKVAPMICFDLRFPELSRAQALQGANLFLVSSAWPLSRKEVFSTLFRARAIENQAYMVSSNFVGTNLSGASFAGSSAIIAPNGDVLTALNDQEEGLAIADISIDILTATRSLLPCYEKRRTDLY